MSGGIVAPGEDFALVPYGHHTSVKAMHREYRRSGCHDDITVVIYAYFVDYCSRCIGLDSVLTGRH